MEWIESSENGACRIEIPYGFAVFDDIELVIRSYAEADKVLLAEEILVVPVAPVIVEDYVGSEYRFRNFVYFSDYAMSELASGRENKIVGSQFNVSEIGCLDGCDFFVFDF